jgi:hypothetical protein
LKKIYLLNDYAAIILSSFVNTPDLMPITAELNVGFDIHLPYTAKDGNDTSLLVAAGPNIAVNVILGLPFIKAMGMIADFVNNICEAKNLLNDPFPINFKCATKFIPVFQDSTAATMFHGTKVQSILHILSLFKSSYKNRENSKWRHIIKPSPEGYNNPHKYQATPSGDTPVTGWSASANVGFPLPN